MGTEWAIVAAIAILAIAIGGSFYLGHQYLKPMVELEELKRTTAEKELARKTAILEASLHDVRVDRLELRDSAEATIADLRSELERLGVVPDADAEWDRMLRRAGGDRPGAAGAALASGDPEPTDGGGPEAVGEDEGPPG